MFFKPVFNLTPNTVFFIIFALNFLYTFQQLLTLLSQNKHLIRIIFGLVLIFQYFIKLFNGYF